MIKVQKRKKVTLDDLWAYLDESKKRRELAFEKMDEENSQLREFIKETSRELKDSIKETDRQLKESQKETDRVVREVSRQLGTIGNSNGDVAEEYFQNAFTKDPSLNGEVYNTVRFNVNPLTTNGQEEAEYDIVMVNGKSIAIIEIKYHLTKKELKEKLSKLLKKAETFKAFYPEYKNHKFYLGIASLSFRKNIEKIIQESGIAVIKQVGDKMVINSKNLKNF